MANSYQWAFFLARLSAGMSMFGHGLVRLLKLSAFSSWMTGKFEASLLPKTLVLPFSYALPIAEFVVGFLLLIGLYTRSTLIAGSIIMTCLIFGSSMIEDWAAIPSQLIHAAYFSVLLCFVNDHNFLAVDNRIKR